MTIEIISNNKLRERFEAQSFCVGKNIIKLYDDKEALRHRYIDSSLF